MKQKMIITVAVLLSATSAHAWDGQKLYEHCQRYREQDNYNAGVCLGYVIGAIDGLVATQGPRAERFCLPSGTVNQGTIVDVVARYLANHPEKRHYDARYLILSALVEAYPCPKGS